MLNSLGEVEQCVLNKQGLKVCGKKAYDNATRQNLGTALELFKFLGIFAPNNPCRYHDGMPWDC